MLRNNPKPAQAGQTFALNPFPIPLSLNLSKAKQDGGPPD